MYEVHRMQRTLPDSQACLTIMRPLQVAPCELRCGWRHLEGFGMAVICQTWALWKPLTRLFHVNSQFDCDSTKNARCSA